MANSEDIEARLCDYVEGELSPADQAEIERHLESHPKHRQMIQDLIRTRGLVAGLPRSKAPSDMTESLQGQLERAMLLGPGPQVGESGRMHKAARLAIPAAVTVLALGLSAGIYFMVHTASIGSQFASMADQPVVEIPPDPIAREELIVPQTQPIAKSDTAPLPKSSPSTRPDAPATQPIIEKSDLAVLATSTAPPVAPLIPTTQPATQPAVQITTQPSDDSDTYDDDSVAPDDNDR